MRKRGLLIFAMALTLAVSVMGGQTPASAASGTGATVNLSVDRTSFAASQGVVVHVNIANPTSQTLSVLRWNTPAEGVQSSLFNVTRNGEAVAYTGRVYKRPQPTAADYLSIKPGAGMKYDVDLAMFYDLSVSGSYAVSYNQPSDSVSSRMNSNGLVLQIGGRQSVAPVGSDAAIDAVTGSTSFVSCSSTRQTQLTSARNSASTYAANAYNYLAAGTTGSRYTTWFGTYNSSRYSTVRTHFSSIKSAMDTAAVTFNCTCTDSSYAYVYPTQPYKIYLCNAFWSAPATGTDSKAGTLIHEMSHFNVVASTDDWAYGQSAAKSLAISNPTNAVDNADSHEYFAENTPSLP